MHLLFQYTKHTINLFPFYNIMLHGLLINLDSSLISVSVTKHRTKQSQFNVSSSRGVKATFISSAYSTVPNPSTNTFLHFMEQPRNLLPPTNFEPTTLPICLPWQISCRLLTAPLVLMTCDCLTLEMKSLTYDDFVQFWGVYFSKKYENKCPITHSPDRYLPSLITNKNCGNLLKLLRKNKTSSKKVVAFKTDSKNTKSADTKPALILFQKKDIKIRKQSSNNGDDEGGEDCGNMETESDESEAIADDEKEQHDDVLHVDDDNDKGGEE